MIKCSEINIELTNVCTMNCDFCSLSELTRSNSFMNDEIFYKTADDIINNNLTDLILPYLMGESLLHKKWFEYISYLTNKTKNSKTIGRHQTIFFFWGENWDYSATFATLSFLS